MSIRNKNKDHLSRHAGLQIIDPPLKPTSEDPLRFWSNHPTENTLIDLHVFAEGEDENTRSNPGGLWEGPFSGRPNLIRELALAVQARCQLMTAGTCDAYIHTLRKWWRLFDTMESTSSYQENNLRRLDSVADLSVLHEAAAHREQISSFQFGRFLSLANDARRLLSPLLPKLLWEIPKYGEPDRQLIPENQAKLIKLAIKLDYQRVRKAWEYNDAIERGTPDLGSNYKEQEVGLIANSTMNRKIDRANWLGLKIIQKKTNRTLPTQKQFNVEISQLRIHYKCKKLLPSIMRNIAFPTLEEADIAYHTALIGSGWNPSTLTMGLDATKPELIFRHPKDESQNVLSAVDEETVMQGTKRRSGGRMQFCMGLTKNPNSPPMVVKKYLERTAALRKQLKEDFDYLAIELKRLQERGASVQDIELKYKKAQILQQGIRSVWLYIDKAGNINWIDGKRWQRYRNIHDDRKATYLEKIIHKLNQERILKGEPIIHTITPSDCRDIYARWVYKKTNGDIISVMIALGHSSLKSTNNYTENNIFNAENDDAVRRFMVNLFQELERGRIDLTILAQLVRHSPITPEMEVRLDEYRQMIRSRINVGCTNPKAPPEHIAPTSSPLKLCGTQRCLLDCPNARFLPESVNGIAKRVEELIVISEHIPLESWKQGNYEKELQAGEYLLDDLYPHETVATSRAYWKEQIASGKHVVPGIGRLHRDIE